MAKTAQEIAAEIKALTKDPVEWDSLILAKKLQPILDDILGSIPVVPSDVLTRSKDVASNLTSYSQKVTPAGLITDLLAEGKLFGGTVDSNYSLPDPTTAPNCYCFFICPPGTYTYEYGPHPSYEYVVPNGSLGFWYYKASEYDPYVFKVISVSPGGGGAQAPVFIDMSLYDQSSISSTNWDSFSQFVPGLTKTEFESICKGEVLQIEFAQGYSMDTDFMPIYTRAIELKAGSHSYPWEDTTYGQIFMGPSVFGNTGPVALVGFGMKIDNPDDPVYGTMYWLKSMLS